MQYTIYIRFSGFWQAVETCTAQDAGKALASVNTTRPVIAVQAGYRPSFTKDANGEYYAVKE